MAIATYTKTGNKATTTPKLDKTVFSVVPENHELLKQAYVAYLANSRGNNAQTKTRGEVRGGGKKPWKQKGTGRARFGSSRNPIWRGGGITFGPTGSETYTHKLHATAKRKAIRQALSLAVQDNKVKIVETFSSMEGKTKDFVKFLDKVDASGAILCVVSQKDPAKERAASNIPDLKVTSATYLNVFEVLNADTIIITEKALEAISEWLGDKK